MPLTDGEGSSPLSRGIRLWSPPHGGAVGIIPALAGNTVPLQEVTVTNGGSSPLSRGIPTPLTVSSVKGESSPLSRGILVREPHGFVRERIIPALAGNTIRTLRRSSASRDHPRSRGEYLAAGQQLHNPQGSSPLSRGIRAGHGRAGRRVRIIPALAGNTTTSHRPASTSRDHPRSRGEYPAAGSPSTGPAGSSPLSRGIRCRERVEEDQGGIIPLSRGIRLRCPCRSVRTRIIPALAGNTNDREPHPHRGWDHPRSRGEYYASEWVNATTEGSSPLSRGIRTASSPPAPRCGIIPALAGNTDRTPPR